MTKQNKENKKEEQEKVVEEKVDSELEETPEVPTELVANSEEKLQKELEEAQRQVKIYQNLQSLGDESYFRLQVLTSLERIAEALETSLNESEEDKE